MTLVVDASVVVAALTDAGETGRWARGQIASDHLAAPHLLPVEVANALRRLQASVAISADTAEMAHAEALTLPADLFPYQPCGSRVWQLRDNVSLYDAWYVVLAELLDAPLVTLDLRLARAPGTRCDFILPPPRP